MCTDSFPVRIVRRFNPETQTWLGRRGSGAVVATGVYRFGANPLTDIRVSVNDSTNTAALTAKVCENSLKLLFSRFRGQPWLAEIQEKLADCELKIAFLHGHDCLMGLDREADVISIACDLAAPLGFANAGAGDAPPAKASGEPQAFELLLLLGHCYLFSRRLSQTPRQALGKVYDVFATFTPLERAGLHRLLEGQILDSGNLFSMFLQGTAGEPNPDQEDSDAAEWRDRQITWLLGQDRMDLPYRRQAAIDILDGGDSEDARRFRLFQLIGGYDRELERGNIERIAGELRTARQQLIFGRMSRAFHNQATLFANAVLLQPVPAWRRLAAELRAFADTAPGPQPCALSLARLLNGGEEIPLTQIEGGCERCEQAIIDDQNQDLADALLARRYRVENHNDALPGPDPAAASPEAAMAKAAQGLQLIERVRQAILAAPKRPAAYVVISQRPSPTGSHLLAKINELRDPYAGKSENLRKLVRLAGDRVYSSPDYGWLELADHWIEAIPLFIKEEVLVRDGEESTRTVIDISGMEVSFREEMADAWAGNLAQVLDSELAGLAREFLSNLTAMKGFPSPPGMKGKKSAKVYSNCSVIGFECWVAKSATQPTPTPVSFTVTDMDGACRSPADERNADHNDLKQTVRPSASSVGLQTAQPNLRLAPKFLSDPKTSGEAATPDSPPGAAPADIAALAVLLRHAYRRQAAEVEKIIEAEALAPQAALRQTLLHGPLLNRAAEVYRITGDWVESVGQALAGDGYAKDLETEIARLAPLALQAPRQLPTLHVLTTQSAGMTEGYIRTWLEESMALFNIVEDLGLHAQVLERERFFSTRILGLAEKAIRELGVWIEVEELCAAEQIGETAAINRLINRSKPIQEQIACLGALIEFEEHRQGRRDPADCREPQAVTDYLQTHAQALRAAALPEAARLTGNSPETIGAAPQDRLLEDEYFRQDLHACTLAIARRQVLETLDAEHPELHLIAASDSYLRRYRQLRKTTARKEIIAELGLNHLTLQPYYYFKATGGGKRYHLIYTPSRVDLGHRERESVETWTQWIGGADRAAAQAGRRIYSLINKDVRIFDSLTEPEILKTGENASMASHFGFSNALGLMINASARGDFEAMADLMNMRKDRHIHPAGEGYGGYCVPKDGLFLEFVLTLNRGEKLRQIGVADCHHQAVIGLANRLLDRKPEFPGELEWEEWAAGQLQRQECLKPYFSSTRGLPVFQVTRIAQVLDHLGKPEIRDHYRIGSVLAAGWGLHKMVTGGEQVNRFMPFFKTWLIRQGLIEAGRRRPHPPISLENSVVVLSAEYKPDTQDARFATGLRKLEILIGEGGHLLSALDSEGQMIAVLLHEGFAGLQRRGWDGKLLAMLNIGQDSAAQLRDLFPAARPPAEIRVVSPMGLSIQDLLNYTSDSRLEAAAIEARDELMALGLSQKEIEANLRTYGARFQRWLVPAGAGPSANLGARLHALALATLGPERDYDYAVRGADVIDAGIPHRALLELLASPVKLCRLMLAGNPGSALVIVDGAAGARKRAMNRDDVMLWFAAAERLGRESVYLGVGLGRETVESWRLDMRNRRRRAERLWRALTENNIQAALTLYQAIAAEIAHDQELHAALAEIDKLRRFGRENQQHRLLANHLDRIAAGVELKDLNFSGFLALGGIYQFLGAGKAEIRKLMDEFHAGVALLGGNPRQDGEDELAQLLRQDQPLIQADFREEKGFESSNKATEERAVVALENRRQLAGRIAKANARQQRQRGFNSVTTADGGFAEHYENAMRVLGDNARPVAEQDFGAFLAHARQALAALAHETGDPRHPEQTRELAGRFHRLVVAGQIDEALIQSIAGGYEDIGDFGRLAQSVRERGLQGKLAGQAMQQALEAIAKGAELFYILLAIDCTIGLVRDGGQPAGDPAIWRALAGFFAKTINDHDYEYRPWVYSRGAGFGDYCGEALYRLAVERHRWLHGHLRFVMIAYTELKDLPADEQDLLLGNYSDGNCVAAIGAGADGETEKIWRAYGQLRELAFIRGDGFAIPEVFADFDPELIQHRTRVNHVIAAPVGRTHFSRALCEGPTLSAELEAQGRRGANLIITRKIEIVETPDYPKAVVQIDSGHLYLNAETYIRALIQHKGYSQDEAERRLDQRRHAKGVRAAVRFSRPIVAALVYPFHGNPVYDSGQLETCGLPYTVQSLFHTWTTYDKTKYREIFAGGGVDMPDETAWNSDYTQRDPNPAAVKEQILHGLPGAGYPGLLAFSQRHPLVMIKDAAESGGRNAQAFRLCLADGSPDRAQLAAAVDFIYQISLRHHVCIQEVVLGSPEYWATEAFMQSYVQRQIVEWGAAVNRDRQPRTPIFGSQRIILSTADPGEPDPRRKWRISHWIALNSKQLITNLGRGGTLEQMLPEFIRPEHRETIIDKLAEAGRRVMESLAACEARCAAAYTNETGREVGADLLGVSYGNPQYMMLDFLIAPVFDQLGELVEIEAVFDERGDRTGSRFMLRQGERIAPANIVDWRVVLIEPNIGVGLWDRVALREEYHELERARALGVSPDWSRVGENARIVLADLNRAGEDYLDKLGDGWLPG